MSTHEVKVVRIEEILPHPTGDLLQLTNIWGYQCVVKKGQFAVGDLAAFIEPDNTVLLNRNEFAFLDDGKGKPRARITMRKFRGERSYGLLIAAPPGSQEGDNVMELLGVERYEPSMRGGLGGPTGFLSGMQEAGPECHVVHYDLENLKKFNKILMPGTPVIISEKCHGTNARYLMENAKMFCGSRTTWKKKPGESLGIKTWTDEEGNTVEKEMVVPNNAWWECAKQNPWIEEWCRAHPGFVLYGEVYGPNVQGTNFHYGKKDGEYGFAVFDILDTTTGKWVDNCRLLDDAELCAGIKEFVVVVYRGPYDQKIVEELAERKSAYPGQKIREGVVVKTETETYHPKIGRVALKHVSDQYLMLK
jgi:RNA ligase (TIGR02306 family)